MDIDDPRTWLEALIAYLPPSRQWSAAERARWLAAFIGLVDFFYPVGVAPPRRPAAAEPAEEIDWETYIGRPARPWPAIEAAIEARRDAAGRLPRGAIAAIARQFGITPNALYQRRAHAPQGPAGADVAQRPPGGEEAAGRLP